MANKTPQTSHLKPASANANYGNCLRHEKDVMHVRELINNNLKVVQNGPILIHLAAVKLSGARPDPSGEAVLH